MTEEEIRAGLERLAPFNHQIELPYGLRTVSADQRLHDRLRLADLLDGVWPTLLESCGGSLEGKRVLDVACNCGGLSFSAADSGAECVLGIDIVDQYLDQANFIKRALGRGDEVEFRKLDVRRLDEISENFDVVLCFGLLYHLEDPVGTMRKVAAKAGELIVLETRVEPHDGPYWLMNFVKPADQLLSTSRWRTEEMCQLRPTLEAVTGLLDYLGFSKLTKLDETGSSTPNESRVCFVARR
jgi:tRNA (mo5U34)-methyltransferase